MLIALLILGMIVVIVLISGVVLIAVTVSQTLSKQATVLDRAHERWVNHVEALQDRLLAHNWEEYLSIREAGNTDEGGFFTPDEQAPRRARDVEEEDGEVEQLIPTAWGSLTAVSDIPRPDADEERLLSEDFDDDGEPRRQESDEERRLRQAQERGVV